MTSMRGFPRLIGALVGLAFFAMVGSANAVMIVNATADPSCTVGDPNTCSLENLSQTTASGVAGNSFEFIYTLNDMFHIELGADAFAAIDGSLDNSAGTDSVVYLVEMALSDETGGLITPRSPVIHDICDPGSFCGFDDHPGFFAPFMEFDGVIFHDVHFFWTTEPGPIATPIAVSITSVLFGSSVGRVGEWTSVPEPSTLALFAIALAGLGFMMRRRVA